MTIPMAFGAARSIWTALVGRKAEWSFLHAKPRCLLNVDNGAWLAGLAVTESELAGVAMSKQRTSRIAFGIARAVYEEIAGEQD
jgi:hypothetical protein